MTFATCLQCQDIVSLDIFWSFRTQPLLWVAYANDVTFFEALQQVRHRIRSPVKSLGPRWRSQQQSDWLCHGIRSFDGCRAVSRRLHNSLKKLEESEHRIKEDEMFVKPFWRIESFALPNVNDVILLHFTSSKTRVSSGYLCDSDLFGSISSDTGSISELLAAADARARLAVL